MLGLQASCREINFAFKGGLLALYSSQLQTFFPSFVSFLFFKIGFLYVALAVLEVREPPASGSLVMGLKVCTLSKNKQSWANDHTL